MRRILLALLFSLLLVLPSGAGQVIKNGPDGHQKVNYFRSFEELEAIMRANDQPDAYTQGGGTYYASGERIDVHAIAADDFVYDSERTTPYRTNLSTGGGEHGLITIDFGRLEISTRSDTVWEVNFGRVDANGDDSPCTLSAKKGFHQQQANCMGFPHDSELRIMGGYWNSRSDSCDSTITASCGRRAIAIINNDALFRDTGSKVAYGTRLTIGPGFKCGGRTYVGTGTLYDSLNLIDDACISVRPNFASIKFLGDIHIDAGIALIEEAYTSEVDIVGEATSGGPRISFSPGFYFFHSIDGGVSAGCDKCGSGLLYITEETSGASYDFNGLITNGLLGVIKGGAVNGHVVARMPTGSCYESSAAAADQLIFLDSQNTATSDALSGHLTIAGEVCVNSLIRASYIDSLTVNAIFNEDLPGFAETDTVKTGHTPPIIISDVVGEINSVDLSFRFFPALDTSDMTFSDLFDSNTKTGGSLNGAGRYLGVDFGRDGFAYVTHNNLSEQKTGNIYTEMVTTTYSTSDPAGSCTSPAIHINTSTPSIWGCDSDVSTWSAL